MNILHTIKRKKGNWVGYIFSANSPLKHVIEKKIERTGIQGIIHEQLLDNVTETRRYWKMKQEAKSRTLGITPFSRDYGPVVRGAI